jgi:hypothetical protein
VNTCHRHRRRQRAQLIVLEGEIKKARGLGPAPLQVYFLRATLRDVLRAVLREVLRAVLRAAAAVFDGLFFFATAMMSLLSGWLAVNSLCYTHSLLDTYSHSRYVASQRG